MRWIVRVVAGLLAVVATVVGLAALALGAAYGLAQTEFGQRRIAALIESQLSGPESRAELRGLHGRLPFDIRIEFLALADAEGVWLTVEDARLAWSPRELLRGRLHIEEIGAAAIEVDRLPPAAEEEEEPAGDEPFAVPRLPETVPPVIVERLAVGRIALGAPVLGQAAAFALEGRMAVADDGSLVTAELDLQRTDEATARATLDAELALDPPALTLSFEAEETGGLLADITGRPEAGAFRLDLGGEGLLVNWEGRLEAVAENLARVDADLALALLVDEPALSVDGRLVPQGDLVPAEYLPLLGDDGALGFGLTATRTSDQQLALDDVHLAAALARLDGRAVLDLEEQRVEAGAAVRVDDLAPLRGLLQASPLAAGSIVLGVEAEGALAQPAVELELRASDLAVPAATVAGVALGVRLLPLDPEAPGWSGARVTADGVFEGVALADGPDLPARDLRLALAGTVPAEGPVAVERLALSAGELLELAATATVDPATLAGRAELRVEAEDLAPLAALAGQAIEGGAALTADVVVDEGAERATVALDGRLVGLAGLPPGADTLLGREVALGADAVYRAGEFIRVTDLAVDGAAVALGGEAALGLAGDRAIDGELTLALPRLDALAPAVGQPIAGEAVLTAALGGTAAAPELRVKATGEAIAFADQTLDSLTAELTALDVLETPHGTLELAAGRAGERLTAGAAYRLEDQVLALTELGVGAPATSLSGELTVRLDGPLVEGRLSGQVKELAALTALLDGPALAGRIEFDAELGAADGRQGVALTAEAADLAGDFGRVAALDLRAEVADALGEPRIEAQAGLRDFSSGGAATLARASAEVAGGLDALDVALTASGGEQPLAFDLAAGARVSLEEEATTVRLDRLDGRVAGRPLGLMQPATVTVAGGAVAVRDLGLGFGTGRLRAEGSYGPDAVALQAAVESLPLDLLGAFGVVDDLAGAANARLELAGPLSDPRGTLTVDLSGVRLDDPAFEGVPAAALALRAELGERRVDASLRIERLTDTPITARLAAPVVLTLEPFAFELPEAGALAGELNAEVRLARIGTYLALDDQEIAGLLRADLDIGGTVAAPALAGAVTLADGRYENGFTGTVLRDIRLQATADGRRIVLRELRATDGGRGRITGEGAVALDPARSYPFELALDLDRAKLLRRDFAEATISGGVGLSGTTEAALAEGKLTVNRAEVNVAGAAALGGGPDIAAIDVVEIGPGGMVADEDLPDAGEEGPPLTVRLNIVVELPGRIFVRGQGLESEWQGRLVVQGTAEDPQIVGSLAVRRGELDVLDRTFQLREGTIEFTGGTPPVPTLDFVAATEAEDFTALVRITGPANDPTIELDSEPALPEDEILSRLLFNRQLTEIGPAQAAQLAIAVNRLRGGGGGLDVLGRIRNFIGVDTLEVAGGETPEEATVKAGKYLSDDVFVGVEKGAGETTGKATVEIEVLPDVTLEAEVREDSRAGVGVQWKFDY